MMEIIRDKYTFIGDKAEESVKYYDLVTSNNSDIEKDYIAWEAAHKFGQKMIGPGIASFRDGIVKGKNAVEVAEYLDNKWNSFIQRLPKQNRRKLIKEKMTEVINGLTEQYDVEIERL